MADDSVQIKIDLAIQNAGAATTIKETRAAIKQLKDAALEVGQGAEGFDKLTKKAGELQDSINDINDAVAIQGSGVQRLTTSFRLLGDALVDADPDAFSAGLSGIGGAMKSIPILALIEGVTFLASKFDILGKIGEAVTNVINDFTDALGLTAFAAEGASQSTIAAFEKNKEAAEDMYEREIALASAANEQTQRLEIEKLKAIENSTALQIKVLENLQKEKGKLNEEELKQYKELQEELFKATTDRLAKEVETYTKFYNLINDERKTQTKLGLSQQQQEELAVTEETKAKLKELNDLAFKQGVVDSEREAKAYNEAEATIIAEGQKKLNDIRFKYAYEARERQIKIAVERIKKEYQIELDFIQSKKELLDQFREEEKAKETLSEDKDFIDSVKRGKVQFEVEQRIGKDRFQLQRDAVEKEKNRQFEEEVGYAESGAKARLQIETEASEKIKKINEEETKSKIAEYQKYSAAVSSTLGQINSIISGFASLAAQQSAQRTLEVQRESELRLQTLQYERDTDLASYETQKNEELSILQSTTESQLANEQLSAEQRSAINDDYQRKRSSIEQKAAMAQFQRTQASAKAEYQIKLNAYSTENSIKQKAFEQDKKLRIGQTIIAGAQGVLAAFSQSIAQLGPIAGAIVGGILGTAITVLTVKQVQAIKGQKYDSGTPPAPPAPVAPPSFGDSGSGSGDSAAGAKPTFELIGTSGKKNNAGTLNPQNKDINVSVNVGVSEVTTTQQKVQKYEEASTLS